MTLDAGGDEEAAGVRPGDYFVLSPPPGLGESPLMVSSGLPGNHNRDIETEDEFENKYG